MVERVSQEKKSIVRGKGQEKRKWGKKKTMRKREWERKEGRRIGKGQRKKWYDRWKGMIKEKVGEKERSEGRRTFKSWYTFRLILFHPAAEPIKLCEWMGGRLNRYFVYFRHVLFCNSYICLNVVILHLNTYTSVYKCNMEMEDSYPIDWKNIYICTNEANETWPLYIIS